jgi:hypothetical protein
MVAGNYTGIGARITPPSALAVMRALAHDLALAGWTLRTGGAAGADAAFLSGALAADGGCEIYTPWSGFGGFGNATLERPTTAALRLAAEHHPAWSRCSAAARALHARNSHEVLGESLDDPSRFVVCWTPDGSLNGAGHASGGTGQALRIAAAARIPVFNLARPDHLARIEDSVGRSVSG